MTFMKLPFAFAAVGAMGLMMPGTAVAQKGGTQAQQTENMRAIKALGARITATEARVRAAQATRKITHARAVALQRRIGQSRQSMTQLGKQQGFVSAAELASYNRTLGTIDAELDGRGVARSFGNDMLPAKHHRQR